MKKLFAIAFLGLTALGLTAGQASAWWPFSHCCHHKCSLSLNAHQYNAFSPYCLDSFNGCLPLTGLAASYGHHQGGAVCSLQDGCCPGELPPAGFSDGHHGFTGGPEGLHGYAGMPGMSPGFAGVPEGPQGFAGPVYQGPQGQPAEMARGLPQGAPTQAWPTWGPGMVNPSGVPSYFPANMGQVPSNGSGR